jgi:hypothetical protein
LPDLEARFLARFEPITARPTTPMFAVALMLRFPGSLDLVD